MQIFCQLAFRPAKQKPRVFHSGIICYYLLTQKQYIRNFRTSTSGTSAFCFLYLFLILVNRYFFSHPDFTVGPGVTPGQPGSLCAKCLFTGSHQPKQCSPHHFTPRVADFTASREFHPAPKNFLILLRRDYNAACHIWQLLFYLLPHPFQVTGRDTPAVTCQPPVNREGFYNLTPQPCFLYTADNICPSAQ